MKRRSFLKSSSVFALPLMIKGFPINVLNSTSLLSLSNAYNDKVLVLIQLNGGNDGLNTLIPLDKYSNIYPHRNKIIIPENRVLKINDETGLHPAMDKAHTLFLEGKMSAIQNVGHPNINLSHFRAQEIMMTGFHGNDALNTGWLGRFLDQQHPTFPNGYPNPDFPDPFAITLGSLVSETCEGSGGTYSMALERPEDLGTLADIPQGASYPDNYQEVLDFVRLTISLTNSYTDGVIGANEKGSNLVEYPETELAQKLKTVARLISGGIQTKIFVLNLGGFDTHVNQVDNSDPTLGQHAELLEIVSDSIFSFQKDLEALGQDQRVLGMVYSEFGRRIKSNSNTGTDHGVAAPMFLFGSCVKQPLYGENPTIPDEIEVETSIPYTVNFQSVYGSLLRDWFGAEESLINNVLLEDFNYLPILQDCNTIVNDEDPFFSEETDDFQVNLYPNPVYSKASLLLQVPFDQGLVTIILSNFVGLKSKTLLKKTISKGKHIIPLQLGNLSPGNYIINIAGQNLNEQVKFRKL